MTADRWTTTKHRLIASALAFVAGYTDVISVTRWRVFATMLTGNLILMGRSTVNASADYDGVWYYMLVILTFCCGVAAWRVVEHSNGDRGASTVGIPFAFLMVMMELVLLLSPWVKDFPIIYSLTVLAYAPMFGVMTAACAAGRLATTTTAATGHFVTVVSTLVKERLLREELSQSERTKRGMGLAILGSTLAGAMVGTMIYLCTDDGSHGALMPVGPALAVLFWLHDHLARPSSLVKKVYALQKRVSTRTQLTVDSVDISPRELSDMSSDDWEEDEELGYNEESPSGSDCGGGVGTPTVARAAPAPCEYADAAAAAAPRTLLTSSPLSVQLLRETKPLEDQGFCSDAYADAAAAAAPRTLLTSSPLSVQLLREAKPFENQGFRSEALCGPAPPNATRTV